MMQSGFGRYLVRLVLVAGLYFITGKIGLLMAVPPGYATVIWPPSGIALGAMIVCGPRLWLGVLLGSFLLNSHISDAYTVAAGLDQGKALAALAIAAGSTLQALAGYALISRLFGLPLSFNRKRDVLMLFVLAGPLACIIAASVGVLSLYAAGSVPIDAVYENWLTWWLGDVFGIFVFLPLTLLAPGNSQRIEWRGQDVGKLPAPMLLVLLIPLGLTFYAWNISSRAASDNGRIQFDALTVESKKALLSRISSYDNALLGGVAYFQGSNKILRHEWKRYVDKLNIEENFPGINGIGWITPKADSEIENFLKEVRADGVPNFQIHPKDVAAGNYVITYIEPEIINRQAVGLNIAFEANRKEAADLSRDTGKPAITKRIILVQDEEKTPGFLLLHPMYKEAFDPVSSLNRTTEFEGWIYAPFIGKNFMRGLTQSQGSTINLRVYDGSMEDPDALIYSSRTVQNDEFEPVFSRREQIKVMQQDWLIVWESTPAFEQTTRTNAPILILSGGLLITFLLGMFLFVANVKRTETFDGLLGRKALALPAAVLIILSAGSVSLYRALADKEQSYLLALINSETSKIDLLIVTETDSKIAALKRLAHRTELGAELPLWQWQADARNYLADFKGLRALGWVDVWGFMVAEAQSYQNERSVWIEAVLQEPNTDVAREAVVRDIPKLTPPIAIADGDSAFIGYFPLNRSGERAGYVASVFSATEFFDDNVSREALERYRFEVKYGGETLVRFGNLTQPLETGWELERPVQILDRKWSVTTTPTEEFLSSQRTQLPNVALIAGFLVSILSAITAHLMLLSRFKTADLEKSNDVIKREAIRSATVMNTVADGVLTINSDGLIETINPAVLRLFGYTSEEVLGKNVKMLMPEPYRHDHDQYLGAYLTTGERKVIGIGREVSAQRKDGTVFPIDLSVNEMRIDGKRMFVGTIRDTSEAVAAAQALHESNSLMSAILASTDYMIIATDLDSKVMVMNEAAENALGYKAEEIVGKETPALWHDADEIAERARVLSEELGFPVKPNFEVFTRPVKVYGTDESEWTFIRKNGSRFPVQLAITALRNENQQITGYVGVILDITKRKEVDRLKSDFVSVVSHELRTPLTSIRGALGLAAGPMAKELPDKANRLIDIAYKNCERLALLINDILDIDKIESGQMRFDLKTENVQQLVNQAMEVNQPYADKLGVSLKTEDIDPDLEFKVDAQRFAQVLANLLSNAAKFSERGAEVELSARGAGNRIRIEVKDHGAGIAEEFRSQIFGKFSQGDSSSTRVKGGSGLGLHISKQLVERMGGAIGFDTELGKGTTFWIELPQVAEADPGVSVAPVEAEHSLLHLRQRDAATTVLHIEDDADLSRVLSMSLQGKIAVETATTLEQGKRKLMQKRYDLVILDLELPDGSGLGILKVLADLPGPRIPVMILSASEVSADIAQTVASVMVKSRASEAGIVEKIESLVAA